MDSSACVHACVITCSENAIWMETDPVMVPRPRKVPESLSKTQFITKTSEHNNSNNKYEDNMKNRSVPTSHSNRI